MTEPGRKRLPAWQFFFKRVASPASVPAVAPPDLFMLRDLNSSGRLGPGTRSPGNAPCNARCSASAVANRPVGGEDS